MARFEEMNEERDFDDGDEAGEVEYYALRPNKTRIKKEIAALFQLGEELSELSATQLAQFGLPEIIRNAVVEVSGMPHKGARKRLLKYIAGQLHKIDVEPFLEQMARIKNQSAHGVREHHMAERWRDHLLNGGNETITELLDELPHADSQRLRQLIRNAKKEAETSKPPLSSRMLYRYLKELLTGDTDEDLDGRQESDD